MTDATVKPVSPAAARTRLMLEGPIVPTLLRLAVPNLVVNVVLIAVTTSVDAHFVGGFGLDALAGLALVFPLHDADAADGQHGDGRRDRRFHRARDRRRAARGCTDRWSSMRW